MSPGKPTLIAGLKDEKKLVLGLPGHPFSCFISAYTVLLPLLNALTTERHLAASLAHQDYVLASIDLGFLFLGGVLAWTAYKVWLKREAILKKPAAKAKRLPKQAPAAAVQASEELP